MNDDSKYELKDQPFIPEGLEYREEYWFDALKKIEAHERAVRVRKVIYLSLAAAACGALLALVISNYSSPKAQLAQRASSQERLLDSSFAHMLQLQNERNAQTSNMSADQRIEAPSDVVQLPEKSYHQPIANWEKRGGSVSTNSANVSERHTDGEPINTADQNVEAISNADSDISQNHPSENGSINAQVKGEVGSSVLDHATSVDPFIPSADIEVVSAIDPLFSSFPHQGGLKSSRKLEFVPVWPLSPFNVQVAVGLSPLTAFSSHKSDLSTDLFVRIDAERNFNRKWATSAGLEITAISGIQSPYARTSVKYDFGYTNTVTTVNTNSLYYLTLPVSVKYRMKQRLQMEAGAGISYLLYGTNSIKVEEVTAVSTKVVNAYDDKGYIKGFRTFNPFVACGTRWWLNPSTSVGVTYQFGLSDITKNNYFENALFDRNSRLMIELKRNIR